MDLEFPHKEHFSDGGVAGARRTSPLVLWLWDFAQIDRDWTSPHTHLLLSLTGGSLLLSPRSTSLPAARLNCWQPFVRC